jgi:hypothetical protein
MKNSANIKFVTQADIQNIGLTSHALNIRIR